MRLWWNLRRLAAKNPKTRVRGARTLGEYQEPRVVRALVAALLGDANEEVQRAVTEALGRIGSPAVAQKNRGNLIARMVTMNWYYPV